MISSQFNSKTSSPAAALDESFFDSRPRRLAPASQNRCHQELFKHLSRPALTHGSTPPERLFRKGRFIFTVAGGRPGPRVGSVAVEGLARVSSLPPRASGILDLWHKDRINRTPIGGSPHVRPVKKLILHETNCARSAKDGVVEVAEIE